LSAGAFYGSRGKFDYRVRPEAHGHAPGLERVNHFAHTPLLIDVNHIDGEPHEEGMDGFTGNDPQARAFGQTGMFEKAGAPLGAGVRLFDGIAQLGISGGIADDKFQSEVITSYK